MNEQVADVLEKTATYVEAVERRNAELEAELKAIKSAETSKDVEKLAGMIQAATGEDVDLDTVRKIAASSDDDVKRLVEKLSSAEEVPSMGRGESREGPTTKEASLPPEDARFLNFVMGSSR